MPYLEPKQDKETGDWLAVYYNGDRQYDAVRFKLKEHARIEVNVYNEYYKLEPGEDSIASKKIDIWEALIEVMIERGMVV